MVPLGKVLFKGDVIHDVAVMGHHEAEGGVQLEGLGVLAPAAADRRVAGVADSDGPGQPLGVGGFEDVADQPVALLGVKTAVIGDDPGRVLAPVLDRQQSLVKVPEDLSVGPDTDNAAHGSTRLELYQIRRLISGLYNSSRRRI